jgi:hypothetical protein
MNLRSDVKKTTEAIVVAERGVAIGRTCTTDVVLKPTENRSLNVNAGGDRGTLRNGDLASASSPTYLTLTRCEIAGSSLSAPRI